MGERGACEQNVVTQGKELVNIVYCQQTIICTTKTNCPDIAIPYLSFIQDIHYAFATNAFIDLAMSVNGFRPKVGRNCESFISNSSLDASDTRKLLLV